MKKKIEKEGARPMELLNKSSKKHLDFETPKKPKKEPKSTTANKLLVSAEKWLTKKKEI